MNKDTRKRFFRSLLEKIKSKKAKIGIMGMGYVGLPLAVCFAKNGFRVTGLDIDKKKVKAINLKQKFLKATSNIVSGCRLQDIIIICVPTPINQNHRPDIVLLKRAASDIGQSKPLGKLIINESTVAPFTTERVVAKIIQDKSGFRPGKDFFLGCSPERVNPGDPAHQVENTAKVIAGLGEEDLRLVRELYSQLIKAPLIEISNLAAAEAVKLLENSYRAVNIALVNELAKYCQKVGLDVLEIIEGAKSKWTFQAHWPGVGVGGHCIPVDPWYLLEVAEKSQVGMPTLKNALIVNESMPDFVADQVAEFYRPADKVLVYGISYKGGVKDVRESPALKLCLILKRKKIKFEVYDPFYTPVEISKLDANAMRSFQLKPCRKLAAVDLLVVATDHSQLGKDSRKLVGKNTVIIDGRNFFREKIGKKVIGVGRRLD